MEGGVFQHTFVEKRENHFEELAGRAFGELATRECAASYASNGESLVLNSNLSPRIHISY